MSRTQSWALGGGAVFLLQCIWFRHFTVDDAFITYRYASNWATGLGPVMNAGERVEGVSNLPWTALLAILKVFGLDPHVTGPLLGVSCGLLCVAWTTRLGVQWSQRQGAPGGAGAGVLLGACAPIAIWSLSGLETLLYASQVTLFLMLVTHPRWRQRRFLLGVLLALVASMRPEGVLLLAAWMIVSLMGTTARQSLPGVLLGFAVLAVPLLGLRLWFYGEWLANPVHAKTSLLPSYWFPGLVYAAKAIVSTLPLWLLAWYGWRSLRDGAAASLALLWVLAQLAFMVVVGGERFPGYRFLVPALPVVAVLAALSVEDSRVARRLWSWRTGWALCGFVVGLLLVWKPDLLLGGAEAIATHLRLQADVVHHRARLMGEVRFLGMAAGATALTSLARLQRPRLAFAVAAIWLLFAAVQDGSLRPCRQPGRAAYHGRLVGEWLRQRAPSGTWVATNAAGALPYFSGLPVIDMLGLTDAHIARSQADQGQWIGHERGDGSYVLQRHPDIVILGGAEGSPTPWMFPGDQQIAASTLFQENYELQRVRLSGFDFTYYRARDGRMPALDDEDDPADRQTLP